MYSGYGGLCVCLSVPRRILTLLHGPGCNLEEWYIEVPPSCATIVHSELHTHMNRTNSSLYWVLPHWGHFAVLRFIFCVCIILCLSVYCMHV